MNQEGDRCLEPGQFPALAADLRRSQLRKTLWSYWLISPWRILLLQLLSILGTSGLLWLFTKNIVWMKSYAYGGACSVLPALVFAYGAFREKHHAQIALLRFYFWEAIKLILAAVMLVLAPKLVVGLNGWALLAGLVVTMKVYAIAAWLHALGPSWIKR